MVYFLPYLSDECGLALASSGDPQALQVEDSPSYFNDVGVELYGNGQIDAAMKMFTYVMKNFPDSEEARFALQQVATIMQELGQQDKVLPFLTKISSNNKENSLGWYADLQRVFILEYAGEHEEALELIESVFHESTVEPEIRYPTALYRAMILSDGLHQEKAAIQAYTDFLASSPPEDLALIAEAELERLTGRPSGAGRSIVAQPSDFPLPEQFRLLQNYPNPFNPITTIRYDLPDNSFVELKIFDLVGREVKVLIKENETAGFKRIQWDGKDSSGKSVPSGMYIYHISARSLADGKQFSLSRKMVLLR